MTDMTETAATLIAEAMANMINDLSVRPPEPVDPAELHRLRVRILDREIPREYRNATVPRAVLAAVTARPQPVSLLLVGPPGTGKTHACWALYRLGRSRQLARMSLMDLRDTLAGDAPAWRPQVRILGEAADIARNRHDRDWLALQMAYPGWLCVDDLGATAADAWVQEAIYDLANQRRAHGRPTVWSTNLEPERLADHYTPAIASRLLGGTVLVLGGEDRRQQ